MNSYGVFTAGPTVALAATTSSAATAFGSTNIGNTLYLYNSGSNTVYVAIGASTVAAVVPTTAWQTAAFPVPPGLQVVISRGDQTHIAVITGTGTSTLNVTAGEGF